MTRTTQRTHASSIKGWEQRMSAVKDKHDLDLDLDFLESISDEQFRDEFVRLPYEDPTPMTSYQAGYEVD